MQEHSPGYMNEENAQTLKDYIEQQNAIKLENAQCIIILCGVWGWRMCAEALGEFNPNCTTTKKILYLIDSGETAQSYFQKHYHGYFENAQYKEILSRVCFEIEAITSLI